MSDSHEATAWEEINPTTALALRQGRQLRCSEALKPAGSEVFRNELTACLALVAPASAALAASPVAVASFLPSCCELLAACCNGGAGC